jgi:hypothetical protein
VSNDLQQQPQPQQQKQQPPPQGQPQQTQNQPGAAGNADTEKQAAFGRALVAVTTDWKTICGSLLAANENLENPPDLAKFKHDAYTLIARRDGTGLAGLPGLKAALAIFDSRKTYAAALAACETDANTDGPHRVQIHTCLEDLEHGGDERYNSDRIIAHYALTSTEGRAWWKGSEASEWVAAFAAYLVDKDTLSRHVGHGVVPEWMKIRGIEFPPDVQADKRAADLRPLLSLIKTGALGAKPDEAAAQAQMPAAPGDEQKKTWKEEADKLRKELEPSLPQLGATGKDVDHLDWTKLHQLVAKVDAQPVEVRDILSQDTTFMRRVALLGELSRAGTGDVTQSLARSLDPVAALFDEVSGSKIDNNSGRINRPQQVADVVGYKPKVGKERFERIEQFLCEHVDAADPTKDQAVRLRVVQKPGMLDTLDDKQTKDLWKIATRGTLAPSIEDRLYPAIKAENGADVAKILIYASGDDHAAIAKLQSDVVFRNAIAAQKMHEEVKVDGVSVIPYDLVLLMWGQKPGDTKDPGQTGAVENDPNAAAKPLNYEERNKLDKDLYNPAVDQLKHRLSAADSFGAGLWTSDANVLRDLNAFAKACADKEFVDLIRRGGKPPGQELATRYNAATGKSIDHQIKNACGEETRRTAERILNISIDSASVGVVGGVAARAGDGPNAAAIGLEQALREVALGNGETVSQAVHAAAADMRKELHSTFYVDAEKMKSFFTTLNNRLTAEPSKLKEIEQLTKRRVFTIELVSNAYMEIDGSLAAKIQKECSKKDVQPVLDHYGLTPTASADRAKEADATATAKPADADATARASAEQQYAAPAKTLFEALSALNTITPENQFTAAAALRKSYEALPGSAPSGGAIDLEAGHGLGAPKNSVDHYRLQYGLTPENHAAQIARAFRARSTADKAQEMGDRKLGNGAAHTPKQVAEWLGVRAELVDGEIQPPPENEKPVVDDRNKSLVRPEFTGATATSIATQMWQVLHGGGEVHLIETTLYGMYNDEEQRLIRLAFRQLSGGIDWQFYVQQAKYLNDHPPPPVSKDDDEKKKKDKEDGTLGDASGDSHQMVVGGEGTAEGKSKVGGNSVVKVTANAGELDALNAIAKQGDLTINDRLRSAASHGHINEIFRLVDTADDAQCRAVLADQSLMQTLKDTLSRESAWDRVYRTLTGSDDLATNLESRAHGDYDSSWSTFWHTTDKEGMKRDIREYIARMREKIEHEEVAKARKQTPPPSQIELAETINRRFDAACKQLSTNPEVNAIITDELSDAHQATARGILVNAGQDSNVAAVAGAGDADEIIAEIKRMPLDERKRRLSDPEYMQRLTKQLTKSADLETAMNLLQSDAKDAPSLGGPPTPVVQDKLADLTKLLDDREPDRDKVLKALVDLSQGEHERLISTPALVTKLTAAFRYGSEKQRAIVEQFVGYDKSQAEKKLGQKIIWPEAPADQCGGRTIPPEEQQRLAFLQESAVVRVLAGADLSYDNLLRELVEVYKMDFKPRGIFDPAAPKKAPDDAPPADGAPPEQKKDAKPKEDPNAELATKMEGDLRKGVWARLEGKFDTKKERVEVARKAVLHEADPSAIRIAENDDWYNTDRDTIAETVANASDELLIQQWTSIQTAKAGGGESYAEAFGKYQKAKTTAADKAPNSPEQGALHDAKLHFMNYVIDASTQFETDVLYHVSSVLWSNDDTKKSQNPDGNNKDLTKERDNEHYNKVRKILRDRIAQMRQGKPSLIAKAIDAREAEDIALINGPNAEVAQNLEFRRSEYLRKFGTVGAGARVAEAERGAVNDTLERYGHDVAVAESKDGKHEVSPDDAAKIEKEGADFDRALKEFSAARAKIASIASAITAALVGAIITVLTGGAGAGIAWMLVAGAISGAAAAGAGQLMQKEIKGSEFDNVEGMRAVVEGAVSGMVFAGTMKVAESMMSSMFVAKELRDQGKAFADVVSASESWGRFAPFIKEAKIAAYTGGEMAIAQGLNETITAGLAPLDPALWSHGWNEGVGRAGDAVKQKISAIPEHMLRASVSGILLHGAGKLHKAVVGERVHMPTGTEYTSVQSRLERVLDPMRVKNNALRYVHVDEQMVQAFASFASDKLLDKLEGKPIDWNTVGQDLFDEFIGALNALSPAVHAGYFRQWQLEGPHEKGSGSPKAKSRDEELKANSGRMTDAEIEHYKALHPDGGTDATISVDDYLAARHHQFELSVAAWEQQLHRALSNEERAEYEKYCREAKDSKDYETRLHTNPLEVPSVKALGTAHPPKPVDPTAKDPTKPPDPEKPVTADQAAREAGAVSAISNTTFDGQSAAEADPAKVAIAIQRNIPIVAGEFPPGSVVPLDGHTLALHVGEKTVIVQVRTMPAETTNLARYRFTGPDTGVIEISDRVQEAHVERALADLVAEMRATREADQTGKQLPTENALAPGSTRTELSAQDLGRIAQLRALARQLEAAEHPPTGEADPKAVEQVNKEIEQLLAALGLTGDQSRLEDVLGSKMPREELNMLIVRGDTARRVAAAAALPAHSGTELHNHFLGVVDPKVFAAAVEAKETANAEKEGKLKPGEKLAKKQWELTLDQIAAMNQHAHTKDGKPVERGQAFDKRGVSGDAVALAKEARKAIAGEPFEAKNAPEWLTKGATELNQAKAALAAAEAGHLPPEEIDRLTKEVQAKKEALAESAVRAAMTATEETDFNSAYEIRDELIKANFGGPKVDELTKELQKVQAEPDSPQKTQRIADLQKQIGQAPYEAFARETVRALILDGLTYNEQSNSLKKLNEKFPKEMLDKVIWEVSAQMVKEGTITEQQAIQLRQLNMVLTGFFGKEDTRIDEGGAEKNKEREEGKGKFGDAEWEKQKKGLEEQYATRSDVVGTDIAGPETAEFDQIGQKRFIELYNLLRQASITRGRPMVLRPHVGEGFTDTEAGKEFDKNDSKRRGEEAAHYDRARKNLNALLTALESIKLDPEHVIIRFGHATHADASQIERMAKLGIVAEVNLHSNVQTGSLEQRDPVTGKSQATENYEDHALLGYILMGAETILSTDAHSVMDTSMAQEYERAKKIIEDFLAGRSYVEVTEARFKAGGGRGEEVVVNAGTDFKRSEYRLHVGDLNGDELARFTHGYEKLQEMGRNYQAKVAAADKGDKLLWKDLFDLLRDDSWTKDETGGKQLHVKDLIRRLAEKNGALDEEALKFAASLDADGTARVRKVAGELATTEMSAKKDDGGDKGGKDKKTETPTEDQNAAKDAAAKGNDGNPPPPSGHSNEHEGKEPTEPPKRDPYADAAKQQDALDAAKRGDATKEQRELLENELKRQVPDVALAAEVEAKNARSVVSVVFSGIKKMNDVVLGQSWNDKLINRRNEIAKEVFAKHGLTVCDSGYKTITLTSEKPASAVAKDLAAAMAEIDLRMKPEVEKVLAEAHAFYSAQIDNPATSPNDLAAAKKHKAGIEDMQGDLKKDANAYRYDMTAGAADLAKPGKQATYDDILAAKMDATKAAYMARDSGEQRVGTFDPEQYHKFCVDTVKMRERLVGQTLPIQGIPRELIKNGALDPDVFRAVRKGEIDPKTLDDKQKQLLKDVQQYMNRVNTLDYMAPFKGDEIAEQSGRVAEARKLLEELKKDQPISKEAADHLADLIANAPPQKDTAGESQFYGRAAKLKDRVVLNADIKDLGVRLFAEQEQTMGDIAGGKDARTAARGASDGIVQEKRDAVASFRLYYAEVLKKAREMAQARPNDRLALEEALRNEDSPLILLGGDEITISLSPAFQELDLINEMVKKLQELATARVAVTNTGDANGAEGHAKAMEAADAGHGVLKKYEELGRYLRKVKPTLPEAKQDRAVQLAGKIDTLYTAKVGEDTVLRTTDGDVSDLRWEAEQLLGKDQTTKILGEEKK